MKSSNEIALVTLANEMHLELLDKQEVADERKVGCSIGIMAYNEEANIARTLYAVLAQTGPSIDITEVIVVATSCLHS